MFEKASRMKLRFNTPIGCLAVEDLWELPLLGSRACLDNIAKELRKEVEETAQDSFIPSASSLVDEKLKLRFEIVKHIISVRLKEKTEAENAEATRQKIEKIRSIIAEKETENLKGKGIDELRELVDSLQQADPG